MNQKTINNNLADQLTRLYLPGGNRDQASLSELETLIETYEFANKGREAFLQGLISLDEFLQILEFCEINVDNYLNTLEDNISRFLIL